MRLILPGLLFSAWMFIGCQRTNGPKLYPVQGSVRINGEAAHFVRVQCYHLNTDVSGNFKTPVGLTDAQGNFQLSTNGLNDGAVPGTYKVTLEWLSGNELAAYDKLAGKFARLEETKLQITVEPKPNSLAPIELTVPKSEILDKSKPAK